MESCVRKIPIRSIVPNRSQPRRDFNENALALLADSIKKNGILQPLTVRRTDSVGTYELIAGERRLRAAAMADLCEVPCIIVQADDKKSAELALIENLHRENLNIFEQAGAMAALIDIYSLTQEQAAHQLSMSQSAVANKLRLLKLSESERQIILSSSLSERHARALLRISDVELRLAALRHIAARSLTVAESESYIEKLLCQKEEEKRRKNMKIVIKDVRIFYNTIDHAIDTMRRAGIDVTSSRRDNGDSVEMTIKIPLAQGKSNIV
jgi:ParB family chromosome partitioning protein